MALQSQLDETHHVVPQRAFKTNLFDVSLQVLVFSPPFHIALSNAIKHKFICHINGKFKIAIRRITT